MSDAASNLATAKRAEQDLNTYQAKTGTGQVSDTSTPPSHSLHLLVEYIPPTNAQPARDSGIDAGVDKKFPSAQVQYGDAATTGAGSHKTIPPEEGGEYDDRGR